MPAWVCNRLVLFVKTDKMSNQIRKFLFFAELLETSALNWYCYVVINELDRYIQSFPRKTNSNPTDNLIEAEMRLHLSPSSLYWELILFGTESLELLRLQTDFNCVN